MRTSEDGIVALNYSMGKISKRWKFRRAKEMSTKLFLIKKRR